jgi:hypothetical protein
MITSISSQPLAGSYKDSAFRKNVITTNWVEETRPSTIWLEEGFNWWDTLMHGRFREDLLTEGNENLLTEQQTEFSLVGGFDKTINYLARCLKYHNYHLIQILKIAIFSQLWI